MAKDWRSQAHVMWDCKYHVVILPKYRQKVFFGKFRRQVGEILRDLCCQREVDLIEGNAAPDHIRMLLSVPPKYSIAYTVGFLKGKSAIHCNGLRELLTERFQARIDGALFQGPKEPDIMYWDEWPVHPPLTSPNLLPTWCLALSTIKPIAYPRWGKLKAEPATFEMLRNLPLRHPLWW